LLAFFTFVSEEIDTSYLFVLEKQSLGIGSGNLYLVLQEQAKEAANALPGNGSVGL